MNQFALLLLKRAQTRFIHLSQCMNVVCPSQLGIYLHNELSLELKLFTLYIVLSLEIETSSVGLFCLTDFLSARLDYFIFQDDTLLYCMNRLLEPLLCSSIVSLVFSTLFVQL